MRRFDDPFQAIRYMIEANVHNLGFKDIACRLFPTCSVRTAENKLNRAMNPDNHDIHFDIEWVDLVMDITGREEILHYWLDRRGYDPARLPEIRRQVKTALQVEEEKVELLKGIKEQLALIAEEPGGRKGKK